ncbi:hypothetical protein DID88_005766 [Monilinia fructigena]|uniref:3-beta hydroxysteroid dehydrogenase/isomerase domain-containing protein n=1 Tax=Monilinia fructigena TaxID=38457 RepID=A0A395J622_9HELO|nr:hypothetical protein DID88_005766 [Monilinia fructigena]
MSHNAHLLAAAALLATIKLGTTPLDHERVDGEAFLITNGSPIPFWDMARAVWAAAGSTKGTEHVNFSCMTRYFNIDKARTRLGYVPLVSLDEGIKITVKHFEEERAREGEKKSQ